MTKPNEPTLTCSEVVERLQREAFIQRMGEGNLGYLDSAKATEILTEWRERRVQELEEALRRASGFVRTCAEEGTFDTSYQEAATECLAEIERVLKSDEWREQIRKGAKHE